jgi:hypothetical protein
VSDEHCVVNVEVFEHRSEVGSHYLRSDAVGAERGAAMAALVETNDAKATAHKLIPDDIPLEDAGGIAMDENHRRPLSRGQRPQHRPVRAGERDFLALRFGEQLFARQWVRVALDPSDQATSAAPAQQTNRHECRARGQPCSHRARLPARQALPKGRYTPPDTDCTLGNCAGQ